VELDQRDEIAYKGQVHELLEGKKGETETVNSAMDSVYNDKKQKKKNRDSSPHMTLKRSLV